MKEKKMREIEIPITELSKLCEFNVNLFRQYCGSYKLSKWIKRKCKPMTFLLNDKSIKDVQDYLTALDKDKFTSMSTRVARFNKGIERIRKTTSCPD